MTTRSISSPSAFRVLMTGARLPVGLEQARKLGRTGHHVVASDSFEAAPGLHSKYVADYAVTASPRNASKEFVRDVVKACIEHDIDLIVPTFEELFYLAQARASLSPHAFLFAPDMATLATLHDKAALQRFARDLGIAVPETILAESREELAAASRQFERFFARPSYTRGGVTLYTNHGPLAGAVELDELEPTAANPFLVQPFVEGRDLCSYSICHDGDVVAHVTYVHPMTLEHAGGITFESVEVPETLAVARKVAEATGYTGQLSFDYMQTADGVTLIECNPRPTSGITVMPDEIYDRGLRNDTGGQTLVAPAGARRQLSLALLRNMWVHWREIPENISALWSGGPDVYADPDDMMPLAYQLLAYGRVIEYKLRQDHTSRSDLMQGYFDDLTWDGQQSSLELSASVEAGAPDTEDDTERAA